MWPHQPLPFWRSGSAICRRTTTIPTAIKKAKYLSAVLEGVLIIVAALAIFREAHFAFYAPKMFDAPAKGLALNAAASFINAGWAWVLVRRGLATRSPALVADGKHLITDVVSSLGVLIGLGLALITKLVLLDAVLAIAVAIVILWSGWRLMSESVGGLMDVAPPPGELEAIRGAISPSTQRGAVEAHYLRTRHARRATFIEFHLIVPGHMTVMAAHGICDEIENALKKLIAQAIVTIHVEPEFKAKHSGVLVL